MVPRVGGQVISVRGGIVAREGRIVNERRAPHGPARRAARRNEKLELMLRLRAAWRVFRVALRAGVEGGAARDGYGVEAMPE